MDAELNTSFGHLSSATRSAGYKVGIVFEIETEVD